MAMSWARGRTPVTIELSKEFSRCSRDRPSRFSFNKPSGARTTRTGFPVFNGHRG